MKNYLKKESTIQFGKYIIVGLSGVFIDLISLTFFVEVFSLNTTIAVSMSFILAVISNFYWNYKWVFSQVKGDIKNQFIKYFTVSLIGLVLTTVLMHVLVDYLNIFYILSKLITIGIVFVWNFTVNKFWSFK